VRQAGRQAYIKAEAYPDTYRQAYIQAGSNTYRHTMAKQQI